MSIHGFFHAVTLRCGWSQGSCFQQAAANGCSQIYSNAQANMNALLQICSPVNLDFDHVSILVLFNMPATLENGRFMAKISSAGIFSNIRRHFSGAYIVFKSQKVTANVYYEGIYYRSTYMYTNIGIVYYKGVANLC